MGADILLSRLEGLRRSGPDRWMAHCPAHDDRRASLSVRELGDGRVLLHCFAECDPAHVLSAVGLAFTDLYPSRALEGPLRPLRRPFPAADVLCALVDEVQFVYLYAISLHRGEPLTDQDRDRLGIALSRLQQGKELACG